MLDEQDLILIPTYDRSRAALPVAGVFGANASGKSSVLDALVWMRRAVLESFAVWQPGSGVARVPFRLGAGAARASSYAVEIQLDGVRYYYGFDVDDESTNVFWLAPFSLGESWHHNHHAFPRSAVHGLRWWEVDPTAWAIRLMRRLRLAWNVVEITP